MRASAASSCARDVESMQKRPVDTESCGKLQQLSRPRVAAAEIAMQRGQGRRLADAVAQSHEVYDGACRIVDANILAGSCLQSGQAKFEGRGLETEHRRRRERDAAAAGLPWARRSGQQQESRQSGRALRPPTPGRRWQRSSGRPPRVDRGSWLVPRPARRKTPWDSSRMSPASRAAYRSRGWSPEARAMAVVNVGGRSAISTMDRSVSLNACPCDTFIHVLECLAWHVNGTNGHTGGHLAQDPEGLAPTKGP